MDKATFEAADGIVDQISDLFDRILDGPESAELRNALVLLNQAIGRKFSANISFIVEIFDREKERALPLLNTGLACTDDEPYRAWGDSTPHKYIANGEMQIVPHDRCPCCWGAWDFKFLNHTCRECGASIGKEVKILLDTDLCPHCEKGRVSASEPKCIECGFEVDPTIVVWG